MTRQQTMATLPLDSWLTDYRIGRLSIGELLQKLVDAAIDSKLEAPIVPLTDSQCIVALDESRNGWIVVRSDAILEHDILYENTASDNGFTSGWDDGLSVGVYLVTLKGWSHQCIDGDWDNGFDVTECKPLWTIPEINYRIDTNPIHLAADCEDSSREDGHDCGEDVCVCAV